MHGVDRFLHAVCFEWWCYVRDMSAASGDGVFRVGEVT